MACEASITGQYLSGRQRIEIPEFRHEGNGHWLTVRGARENNAFSIESQYQQALIEVQKVVEQFRSASRPKLSVRTEVDDIRAVPNWKPENVAPDFWNMPVDATVFPMR